MPRQPTSQTPTEQARETQSAFPSHSSWDKSPLQDPQSIPDPAAAPQGMPGGSFLTHLLLHPLLRAKDGRDSRIAALDSPGVHPCRDIPVGTASPLELRSSSLQPQQSRQCPSSSPAQPLWEGTTRGAQEAWTLLLSKGVNT